MRAAQEGGVTERTDVTALLGVHWQVRAVGAQLTETLATLIAPTTQERAASASRTPSNALTCRTQNSTLYLQQRAIRLQHRAIYLEHRAVT